MRLPLRRRSATPGTPDEVIDRTWKAIGRDVLDDLHPALRVGILTVGFVAAFAGLILDPFGSMVGFFGPLIAVPTLLLMVHAILDRRRTAVMQLFAWYRERAWAASDRDPRVEMAWRDLFDRYRATGVLDVATWRATVATIPDAGERTFGLVRLSGLESIDARIRRTDWWRPLLAARRAIVPYRLRPRYRLRLLFTQFLYPITYAVGGCVLALFISGVTVLIPVGGRGYASDGGGLDHLIPSDLLIQYRLDPDAPGAFDELTEGVYPAIDQALPHAVLRGTDLDVRDPSVQITWTPAGRKTLRPPERRGPASLGG